ncbi:MmgE/PrpD family protein [Pseudonocardia zijingensis]|uniref:MmgE/PrpD family protein n=1 Tax=Pseudonocardia zijingensis TaxID=153376 RepID=A0ABN1QJG1_9PSEU
MTDTAALARGLSAAITQAVRLHGAPLAEPVRRHALHVVADTVGVSIGGGRTPEMTRLRATQPPGGSATVLAPGAAPTTAEEAAFLNATAGSFLELDEGMRPTGHPGMHVVPAALAAAEVAHRSGAELLTAVVAGYEVAARLLTAFRLTPPTHPHGHLAGVGAAVAVALLLDEDPHAVAAIAATTPTVPVWNACYEGATARNTAMGLAAQNALRAVRLHRAGFRGSRESVGALFGQVTGQVVAADALDAELDPAEPAILRNYFKRHSACALTHGAIDAVLSLPEVPVEEISAVEVRTVANNLKLDRQAAPNDLSSRFSLPYAVAAALTRRASEISTFDYRPPVAELARRVRVTVDCELERQWPHHSPTQVVVHAGERLVATVDDPRGHHHDPLTADELRAKFLALTGEPGPQLWDRLLGLDREPDVITVLAPLRGA